MDNIAGVVLNLNGYSNTIGSLNGGGTTGGNVTLGSGTLTTGALNTTDTFAGVISGSGGLTKTGIDTMTLSGANIYSGATTVNGGTLKGGAANVFGGASSTSALVMGGGILDMDGNSQTFGSLVGSGSITSGAAGTITLTIGNDGTSPGIYSGSVVNGSATVALTKVGTGTLILGGTNSYTGATTISAGTLQFNTVPASSSITNHSSLVFDESVSGTYAHVISGTGSLTHNGSAILTLSGANTYSGTTTVNAGILQGGAADVFGGASSNSALVMGGGTLDMDGNSQAFGSLAGTGTITSSASGNMILTIGHDNTNPAAFSGIIQNGSGTSVSLTKVGSGTQILSGANTYTGATTVNGGTLEANGFNVFGGATSTSALVMGGGTLDLHGNSQAFGSLTGSGTITTAGPACTLTIGYDGTSQAVFSGKLQHSLSLTKVGTGTLILSGANNYSGLRPFLQELCNSIQSGRFPLLGTCPIMGRWSSTKLPHRA